MIFRKLFFAALVVGLLVSLVYSFYQQSQISPLIIAAEQYEVAAPAGASTDGHDHSHGHWQPESAWQRLVATVGANVLIGIAFALVLISLMALHNLKANKPDVSIGAGLLWGIAALVSVFVAPALFGLHPEVPGTIAAQLEHRQAWWIFCVLATALGIAALYYCPLKFKLIGLLLIAVPHLIGAPLVGELSFANTDPTAVSALTTLSKQFYYKTLIGMAVFCLLLGVLSAYASQRYVKLN